LDDRTFDHLTKTLSATPSRRGLLAGLLAAAGLGAADVAAKRKHRGKGKGKGKGKDKGGNGSCTPDPKARVCAGRCGPVSNRQTCGKTVTCDPCDPCAADGSTDGTACALDGGGPGVCAAATCAACGGPGEPCCDGDTCADFGCCDPATSHCVAGGGISGVDYAPRCAGEAMVCDCGTDMTLGDGGLRFTCTRPGVCRANHAPVASGPPITFPSDSSPCIPVHIWSFDRDGDETQFLTVVSPPTEGWLSDIHTEPWKVVGAAPAAVTNAYPILTFNSILNMGGWADDLPPLPLPEGTPVDCSPRCLVYSGDGSCLDSAGNSLPLCPDCTRTHVCPEGEYVGKTFCYIPFNPTRSGFDSFQMAVIDQHGAQSAPVTVTIELIEA
jgi:hypothetical protein